MSSLKTEAAAKWLVRNQINNAAQPLTLSPQGISTFNNVYQTATASLLNLFGTTDTAMTKETDPGFGRTPQALRQQSERENSRDNADRFYMEQFLTSVMKKFCNLLSKKQSSAITVRLFKEEMEQLSRSYPEIKENYDEEKGELKVLKGKSGLYDYEIVSGSTYAVDQKQQSENLALLLEMFQKAQTPNGNMLVQTLEAEGYTFKFGELFKRIVSNSGIQDWDKILEEKTEEEKADSVLKQTNDQFQQALIQMQGNVNQTPPMPGEMPMEQPMPNGEGVIPPQGY